MPKTLRHALLINVQDVCHLNTSRVKKREVLPSPYEPVF